MRPLFFYEFGGHAKRGCYQKHRPGMECIHQPRCGASVILACLLLVDCAFQWLRAEGLLSFSLWKTSGNPTDDTSFSYDARVALNLPASHTEFMLKLKKELWDDADDTYTASFSLLCGWVAVRLFQVAALQCVTQHTAARRLPWRAVSCICANEEPVQVFLEMYQSEFQSIWDDERRLSKKRKKVWSSLKMFVWCKTTFSQLSAWLLSLFFQDTVAIIGLLILCQLKYKRFSSQTNSNSTVSCEFQVCFRLGSFCDVKKCS